MKIITSAKIRPTKGAGCGGRMGTGSAGVDGILLNLLGWCERGGHLVKHLPIFRLNYIFFIETFL